MSTLLLFHLKLNWKGELQKHLKSRKTGRDRAEEEKDLASDLPKAQSAGVY